MSKLISINYTYEILYISLPYKGLYIARCRYALSHYIRRSSPVELIDPSASVGQHSYSACERQEIRASMTMKKVTICAHAIRKSSFGEGQSNCGLSLDVQLQLVNKDHLFTTMLP